jgi:hypothetical protein
MGMRATLLTRTLTSFTALAMLAGSFVPLRSDAAMFNPSYIISDAEMRDAHAMEFMDVVMFLGQKGGLNNHFDTDPEDGLLKGTAQLIDDAAKRYNVNPKYVLVRLQMEQNLIESDSPTQNQLDWAAGYALCDGCYKTSELAQKYKGLARQIDAAAGWIEWYWENYSFYPSFRKPGEATTVSGMTLIPANLATAALYTYTPHVGDTRVGGNKLFWSIWQRWWGDGESTVRFPDGTLLQNTVSGAVALIQGGKLRPVLNASVLSTRFSSVVPIALGDYEFKLVEQAGLGSPIKFPDWSLVRTEDGGTFLLDGDHKRPIPSMEVFAKIGFNPEEVEDVTSEDLDGYLMGEPVTLEGAYPLGQLLQNTTTGGVYFVQDGVRHPIWDRSLLDANWPGRRIIGMAAAELDTLPSGDPVRFRDGTLVKAPNDPAVYVIEDGAKRSIPSEEVFLGYGYRWSSIITTSDRSLTLHPTGEPLLLFDEGTVEATLTSASAE